MIVLGIDTATSATSVAVCELEDGSSATGLAPLRTVVELRDDPRAGARPAHARALLKLVDRALSEAGATLDQVQRIAVGTGPGTFTGLRIGIASAKGLALGAGIPLVGVSSLRALALGARATALRQGAEAICAVIDARRGEVFTATWSVEDVAAEHPISAPTALAPQRLAEQLLAGPRALVVGDGALAFASALGRAAAPVGDATLHRVSAAWHCRLAAGGGSQPGDVLPQYLRLPDAELARLKRR